MRRIFKIVILIVGLLLVLGFVFRLLNTNGTYLFITESDKCSVKRYECRTSPKTVIEKACTYGGDSKTTYYKKTGLFYIFYFDKGLSGFPVTGPNSEASKEAREYEQDQSYLAHLENECSTTQ